MIRRATVAAALVLGAACLNTSDPSGFIFRYSLQMYGCATTCDTAGNAPIDTVDRGDTVWLEHIITLLGAVDSLIPEAATLRADCAGHIAVLNGNIAVRTVPTPTCPDSTFEQDFTLKGITAPQEDTIYTRWAVDSGLTPGLYVVRGQVMVRPRVEPSFAFTIR